jgi:hypothetical protein
VSEREPGARVEPIEPPAAFANDLERFFYRNHVRTMLKWRHYFEVYERHFERFRGKPVTLVEIGVFKGGSLHMWRAYFGDAARIWGIDNSPKAEQLRADGFDILVGDQADPAFLRQVVQQVPRPDILIDDGGHRMEQQITTFDLLFPWVADDGVYVCEDLHTSYWPEFGGGYRAPGSYVEYSKQWIDALNAWHSRDAGHVMSAFTRCAWSMHYYDSMLVVEKRRMREPESLVSGAGRLFRVLPG